MAKAVINLQKESGGIVKISPVDGIGITEVTVPESGELATKDYVDNSSVPFVANDDRVKTALNASGNAPIYACRAWVNFDGTGTVAIRKSGNVSSIADNGTGQYAINFTTAMPDANYSVSGSAQDGYTLGTNRDTYYTTSVNILTWFNTYYDIKQCSIAIFR